ncbi:Uncharacterised protein [Vibrio cholerae]|nr:Uncharacterised protein [Vibrio cholerae]
MSDIHAIPKMAIAATMPDLNTTPLGTERGSVLVASKMIPPKQSMII